MLLRRKLSITISLVILLSWCFFLEATDTIHLKASELRLLVYTLRGEFLLVDRITGKVLWQHNSGFATECNYSGGPIILPEPLNGRLYVYSNVPSKDILYSINSTVADLVSRSPEFINSLYSTGYKSDHWLHFDLASGQLIKNTGHFPAAQYSFKTEGDLGTVLASEADGSLRKSKNKLAVGISQYHFALWDLTSGHVKFNMTYQMVSSQAEPDFQSSTNLTHLATLQPSLITFSGTKFLWRLPLSSPVVDLFTVYNPPLMKQQSGTPLAPFPGIRSLAAVPKTNTAPPQYPHNDQQGQADSERSLPFAESLHPPPAYQLRRLIFTTYALDLNATFYVPHLPSYMEAALWEDKFCGTLNLIPALYIGESEKTPLYAIRTISETSLSRRATHRVAERLWLAASAAAVEALANNDSSTFERTVALMRQRKGDTAGGSGGSGDFWPRSLFGLYELSAESPRVDPTWSPKPHTSNRLFRITDASPSHDAIILPGSPLSTRASSDVDSSIVAPYVAALRLLAAGLLCLGCLLLPVVGLLWTRRRTRRDLSLSVETQHNSPTLPASFDSPDASGWAGHTADSVAHPGVVRFNTNHPLGRGSNGTIVFDGFYGSQPAAIKRILRQPAFEKSWLREHNILLQHHHEHLIRCYWTGSSPNFHYLVLQRCEKSLLDVFFDPGTSSLHPLNAFDLSVIQSLYQLATAVSFLHSSGVVHRDIKPGNVFLLQSASGQFRLVLGDFGLSLPVQNGHFQNSISLVASAAGCGSAASAPAAAGTGRPTSTDDCDGGGKLIQFGSLGWMAPEMTKAPTDLTPAVDVFAYGLVAFFILSSGRHPFDLEKEPAEVDEDVAADEAPAFTSLHTLQSIQMAINGCKQPVLRSLSERSSDLGGGKIPDRMAQFLAQQLVQEALISVPSQRPPIDVLAKSPLFWSADEVMTFYTELSNFLDEPKPARTANGAVSHRSFLPAAAAPPSQWQTEMDDLQRKRRSMVADVERHSSRVFPSSWLRHLDPLLVEDLRSVRSYQENSLVHLLRAVRNKRSHIWTLNPRVRALIGETDAAMANHWNYRFPSLLPVLTCLARCHLHDVPQFHRFWPVHEGASHALSAERAAELLQFCEPSAPAKWVRMQVSPEKEVSPPKPEPSTAASEEEASVEDDVAAASKEVSAGASVKTKRTRRRRPRELPKGVMQLPLPLRPSPPSP